MNNLDECKSIVEESAAHYNKTGEITPGYYGAMMWAFNTLFNEITSLTQRIEALEHEKKYLVLALPEPIKKHKR